MNKKNQMTYFDYWPNAELFAEHAITDEVKTFNSQLLEMMTLLPDPWSFSPEEVRQARAEGKGPFPLEKIDNHADDVFIKARDGYTIHLHIIRPQTKTARGIYLHFHGGGWMYGSASYQDERLRFLSEQTGLIAISVDYRHAPEYPYPYGPNDCEDALEWCLQNIERDFGVSKLFLGGESAGAHLSVVSALRMRDKQKAHRIRGLNLIAGCYDLRLSPSARAFNEGRLLLTTRDIEKFIENFISNKHLLNHCDVSPIFADLENLPPAHFSIGTKDPLLDDSVMLAQRWKIAGNKARLSVYPGGCHVFEAFPKHPLTSQSLNRINAFLNLLLED